MHSQQLSTEAKNCHYYSPLIIDYQCG